MADREEAKPVTGGYDFGDDWLEELEEALDFDMPTPDVSEDGAQGGSESAHKMPNGIVEVSVGAVKVPAKDAGNAEAQSDAADEEPGGVDEGGAHTENAAEQAAEETEEIGMDIDFDGVENEPVEGHSVTAQVLDIASLQKSVSASKIDVSAGVPAEDAQLWQFISLISMRLFDDLELIVVQKNCDEACDLMKQIHRLANILAFAGMDEQLPLLAYVGNMMPVSFTIGEIGEETERQFDSSKMRHFVERSNEILNCLVYLLTYFRKQSPAFDTDRFSDVLERLYVALDATPGQPSNEAPLPGGDDVNPHELTTRTLGKLARTLEALVSESLHYLESAAFYGYARGYEDAAKSIDSAAQIIKEYHLFDFEDLFKGIYKGIRYVRTPNLPEREVFIGYMQVFDNLQRHFSKQISDKKLRHLKTMVAKFNVMPKGKSDIPFDCRWKTFMKEALPKLEFEYCSADDLLVRVKQLNALASDNGIEWLADTFSHLELLWDMYAASCAEAFIALAEELRSFPDEGIDEGDVEQLNHDRLRILFARKPEARMPSAYSVVNDARMLADILLQQIESPAVISAARIYELMIDARLVSCHAIERVCEIFISLLEHVPPRSGDNPAPVPDTVVDALYFTSGLLQEICERLLAYIEKDPHSPVVSSKELFYTSLMSLYQTPGLPLDGVSCFINRRIDKILNELRLVWVNSSTATSTEYYCGLIRKLLRIATMCEFTALRQQLLAHLDEVPPQDFVNTENRMMQRQCARILRMVEDTCPKVSPLPNGAQVLNFFSKTIAAFNQLLSSHDADSAGELNRELACIEKRMSQIGMMTDFPPAIAFIHELHHMAYTKDVSRTDIEDLLYWMMTAANNVCPEWSKSQNEELDFIRTEMTIPMQLFQEMYDSVGAIYNALKTREAEEPVACEQIALLRRNFKNLVGYLPFSLRTIVQNAQNRCRYLKKNIYIDLDTTGYPKESEVCDCSVPPMIAASFCTIISKLLEIIVDHAFLATDYNSRIDIVLQPFVNEVSAAISHNGRLFSLEEIRDRLEKVNIVPAMDDNLFDLLVSSRRLAVTYPPVGNLSYILPILRQFGGTLDMTDDKSGSTCLYLKFDI